MQPHELKAALANPIVSLPTFFTREGAQDLESLRRTMEFVIAHDMKVLLLTAGDSNYELQSEEEIRAVARTVVEAAAGKATVVVGTAPHWWHDQIIGFARYVDDDEMDELRAIFRRMDLLG